MTQLKMLSADDAVTEIRRLYFATSRHSIEGDLTKALDLLKAMPTEDDRERATVYMEGLAEMAKDWSRASAPKGARKGGEPVRSRPQADATTPKKPGTTKPAAKRPAPKASGGSKKKG